MSSFSFDHNLFPEALNWRGVEVTGGRLGQLDAGLLRAIHLLKIHTKYSPHVLDLGGGSGIFNVHMARAGAHVWMVDRQSIAETLFQETEKGQDIRKGVLNFIHKNFEDLEETDLPSCINLFYSQRSLHYITYHKALSLLQKVYERMPPRGWVFISMAGLGSPFAKGYPHAHLSIENRFCPLAPAMQQKYSLHLPLTIYDPESLVQLLKESGFHGTKVRLSERGGWNLEALARKRRH